MYDETLKNIIIIKFFFDIKNGTLDNDYSFLKLSREK